jgi:hypothetical protein
LEWEELGEGIGKPLEVFLLPFDLRLGGCRLEDIPNFRSAAEGEKNALNLFDFKIRYKNLHSFEQALSLYTLPLPFILIIADNLILNVY